MAKIIKDYQQVARLIKAGEVVVIPTDTVYGLACDPRNLIAVEQIYSIKKRPHNLELILLAADISQITSYVQFSEVAQCLAERFWPGALTMVLPAKNTRQELVIPRTTETLAVRIPEHQELQQLLRITGPLATTSANHHGEPGVIDSTQAKVTFTTTPITILDGGVARGQPSTIIDCSASNLKVLRQGSINITEEIWS